MSRLNASTSPWRALRIRSASSTARKINFRSPYLLTRAGPEKSARAESLVTSLFSASVGSFGKNACGNLGSPYFVWIKGSSLYLKCIPLGKGQRLAITARLRRGLVDSTQGGTGSAGGDSAARVGAGKAGRDCAPEAEQIKSVGAVFPELTQ